MLAAALRADPEAWNLRFRWGSSLLRAELPRGGTPSTERERSTVARGAGKREQRQRRRLRLLLPVIILTVMAFLYYRPLSSYLETRSELGSRRAEVVSLRAEKLRLERRLARNTSEAALARDARRIGYVKPGERLFIIKGIATWQRRHDAVTP